MSGPFRKAISIVSDTFHSGSETKTILSIELSPDGFSYAIMAGHGDSCLMIESFQLNDALPPQQFAAEFVNQINQIPLLFGPFETVNIGWYHPHFVLVPEPLFQHTTKEQLYGVCSEIPAYHQLKAEKLINLGAYGIYPVPGLMLQKLGIIYPGHKFRHTASVLIESILAAAELGQHSAGVVLHIDTWHFEMILLKGVSMIFYNSFAYQTFDDLMYFLFYVLEQFSLDAGELNALVTGKISIDSEKFTLLGEYFKNVGFFEISQVCKSVPGSDQMPHHYFHNLINLNACG